MIPRKLYWADQYDFDRSDPATRLFVAASNWVDRCEAAKAQVDALAAQLETCKEAHMSNCLDADKLRTRIAELRRITDEMVNRFLTWPLPVSACADLVTTRQGPGRTGTNLLSFTEAREMLEYVLAEIVPMAKTMNIKGVIVNNNLQTHLTRSIR